MNKVLLEYFDVLQRLENFNLIKYTDHYVLTIDRGMGKPIAFHGDDVFVVLKDVKDYLDRVGYPGEF